MTNPADGTSAKKGFFGFLSRLFGAKEPESGNAKPPPPPPPTTQSNSRRVIRFVLLLPDPAEPRPAGDPQIVGEAYFEDTPGQKRKYGTAFYAGANVLDMLEAQVAVSWKQFFDSGECKEDRACSWLLETRRLLGADYLRELPETNLESVHMFHGLSKVAVHLMIGSLARPDTPEAFVTLFNIQLAGEEARRRRARDLAIAPQFANAYYEGRLDPEFARLIRKSTGFFQN